MTGEFEQEVSDAFQIFIAAVMQAAERTAVETIRSTCARVLPQAVRAMGASNAPGPLSAAHVARPRRVANGRRGGNGTRGGARQDCRRPPRQPG